MYCGNCGQPLQPGSTYCASCGSPAGGSAPVAAPAAKDKTVAVLLAVFLGFWTWVYTYQRDSGKFWLNLVLSVVTLGIWGIVAWIWAIVDACTKPTSYYANFPNG